MKLVTAQLMYLGDDETVSFGDDEVAFEKKQIELMKAGIPFIVSFQENDRWPICNIYAGKRARRMAEHGPFKRSRHFRAAG